MMKKFIYLLLCAIGFLAVSCNNEEQPSTPYIKLSHETIDAWYDTEIYIIDVYANCEWKATSDSDWVVIQKGANSQDDGIIKFELAQNDTTEPRTAKITVEAVGYTDIFKELTITQSVLSDDYFKINYTSTDNKVVTPYLATAFDSEIVLNTYENGVGTILFDKPVTKVGDEAFCDCSTLKSITLPDSVTELGGWAFFGCIYLEEATLSNRLKTIGDAAFSSCCALSSITLPQSLGHVGDSAFYGCSGMSGYYGKYASADNRCLVIDNTLRHFAPKGLTKYEIADGIGAIAHDAFYESLRLQSITIPQSVTSIGEYAFYYCESLKSIYCKRSTPATLGAGAFDNSDNGTDKPIGCKIYVPTSAVELYKSAENWKRYKSYIYGDETL
jgi:hypothetical protein